MRKRNFNINVRVTESEKKRLTRAAKRCGISLSEYLMSTEQSQIVDKY